MALLNSKKETPTSDSDLEFDAHFPFSRMLVFLRYVHCSIHPTYEI
jgi:hypothetical protein